jgi:hypothetical protein
VDSKSKLGFEALTARPSYWLGCRDTIILSDETHGSMQGVMGSQQHTG